MSNPIVIAMGQTFPDLSVEQIELDRVGARIVDGRSLVADDPLWGKAAGILLGTAARLDAVALDRLSACKGVVRYGIGYDNVDVEAAHARNMVVAIVRNYCVAEVAEHALAFALSMARGLGHWDRNMRAGAWRGEQRPEMHRLSNLTYGVVGFGLIGREAASKALGLFGDVLVYDPAVTPTPDDRNAGFSFADDLASLLRIADVVTVHLPLVPATRGLINADNIVLMKSSAYLINVSRGGIIDELAALEAVRNETIAGAAFDTFEKEPVDVDHPFITEPRILLSPHAAWISEEAEYDLRRLAAADMARILMDEEPTSPVP